MAALDHHQSARRAAGYALVEDRLFETLGAWAVLSPEPEVKAHLDTSARRHAWHAELWRGLAPTGPVAGGDPTLSELAGVLDHLAEDASTLERLVGAYRVMIPRVVVAYRHHGSGASPISDGPITRVLRLVLADEAEEWADGEALVQALLTSPARVERAATTQAGLERLLGPGG